MLKLTNYIKLSLLDRLSETESVPFLFSLLASLMLSLFPL